MPLGKFQKKGMRYLNSLPNVVCKSTSVAMLQYLPATYRWYLNDMDEREYIVRMSETEASFIVLERVGFYRGWNDNKIYTTGGRTCKNMHELKSAVQAILEKIEAIRKDQAEYMKKQKAKEIVNAAGVFEV